MYVGVTSNLPKRIWEHKNHFVSGFASQYDLGRLVWYEAHESMIEAIHREKAIKNWKREWKLKRINAFNPEWRDLYEDLS